MWFCIFSAFIGEHYSKNVNKHKLLLLLSFCVLILQFLHEENTKSITIKTSNIKKYQTVLEFVTYGYRIGFEQNPGTGFYVMYQRSFKLKRMYHLVNKSVYNFPANNDLKMLQLLGQKVGKIVVDTRVDLSRQVFERYHRNLMLQCSKVSEALSTEFYFFEIYTTNRHFN